MFKIENKQLYITELKNESVIETLIELEKVRYNKEVYVDDNYVKSLLSCCLLLWLGDSDFFTSYEQYEHYKQHLTKHGFDVKDYVTNVMFKKLTLKVLTTEYQESPTEQHLAKVVNNVTDFITFYNLFRGLKKRQQEHVISFMHKEYIVKNLLHFGKSYLTNIDNFSYVSKLSKLNLMLCKYQDFFFNPNNDVDTLQKQVDVFDIYDKNYEQYGEYLNNVQVPFETWLNKTALRDIVANIFRTKNRKLAQPLTLPEVSGGWEVKQLNTVLDLIEEGQFQHNCIGSSSYAETVRRGRGIAVSLRKNNKRHTIFFHLSCNKWKIEQDRGFANKKKEEVCSDYDVKLINYNMQLLLEYLNKHHIKRKVEELF